MYTTLLKEEMNHHDDNTCPSHTCKQIFNPIEVVFLPKPVRFLDSQANKEQISPVSLYLIF